MWWVARGLPLSTSSAAARRPGALGVRRGAHPLVRRLPLHRAAGPRRDARLPLGAAGARHRPPRARGAASRRSRSRVAAVDASPPRCSSRASPGRARPRAPVDRVRLARRRVPPPSARWSRSTSCGSRRARRSSCASGWRARTTRRRIRSGAGSSPGRSPGPRWPRWRPRAAPACGRAAGPAEIDEVPVRLPRLPRALDGLTVVQISDLHVGPTIRRREVDRVVEQANALKPDVVAITGDLWTAPSASSARSSRGSAGCAPATASTSSPATTSTTRASTSGSRFLPGLGIRVLRNERVAIGDAGASFDLAGVDDWHAGRFGNGHGYDLARAVAGRDPDRALVLLAHQPLGSRRGRGPASGCSSPATRTAARSSRSTWPCTPPSAT